MSQLVALRSLRDALDRALEHLASVLPAIEAWQASQATASEPQEHAPEPAAAPVPSAAPPSLDEPFKPTVGLFDPLPDPVPSARRRSENGAHPTGCERCGAPVEQPRRGAKRRYCGTGCRAQEEAERMARRQAVPDLAPLPDQVERPFAMFDYQDDLRSDPDRLRPPALDWESASA